jgi:hypothetical protein
MRRSSQHETKGDTMRKTLMVMVAGLALAATAAVPAGASVLGASPAQGGGSYGTMAHGSGGRGDGGHEAPGRGGDHHPDGDHGRGYGDDRHDYYYYGPYDPYDGPYDPYYGDCPAGGYYDANGTYWYWDPATGTYDACPDS